MQALAQDDAPVLAKALGFSEGQMRPDREPDFDADQPKALVASHSYLCSAEPVFFRLPSKRGANR